LEKKAEGRKGLGEENFERLYLYYIRKTIPFGTFDINNSGF